MNSLLHDNFDQQVIHESKCTLTHVSNVQRFKCLFVNFFTWQCILKSSFYFYIFTGTFLSIIIILSNNNQLQEYNINNKLQGMHMFVRQILKRCCWKWIVIKQYPYHDKMIESVIAVTLYLILNNIYIVVSYSVVAMEFPDKICKTKQIHLKML